MSPKLLQLVLRVPNGERNFKMTYLRAPWIIFNIIAYLSFSAKTYFLCNFFLQNFHFEKSYGDLIFYVFELRCTEKKSFKFFFKNLKF